MNWSGLLFLVSLFLLIKTSILHSSLIERVDQLELHSNKQRVQDSLVKDHYSRCSFIHRDEVVVGYDNYLRYVPMKGKAQ